MDQRSDIYALGCVLFTVITGRPPFLADCAREVIAMHLCEEPPAPSQLRPGIPHEIDRLVLRCLAKPAAVEKPRPPAPARDAPDGQDGLRTKPAPAVELDENGQPITR